MAEKSLVTDISPMATLILVFRFMPYNRTTLDAVANSSSVNPSPATSVMTNLLILCPKSNGIGAVCGATPIFLGPHKIAGSIIGGCTLIRLRRNAVNQSWHRFIGVEAINIYFCCFVFPVDLLPGIRFPTVIPHIVNMFIIRGMISSRMQNTRGRRITVIDLINTYDIPIVKSGVRYFGIRGNTPLEWSMAFYPVQGVSARETDYCCNWTGIWLLE